jgi:tRNA pseudouridine38-40 synthase
MSRHKPRYFLRLSYDGSAYRGWARQPGHLTVQQTIEEALCILLREPEMWVQGAGRTDSGVHALETWCHFETQQPVGPQLLHQLNGLLPPSIGIAGLYTSRTETMHARFSAHYRYYQYWILRRPQPLLRHRALWVQPPLDPVAMQRAADLLLLQQSFACFQKAKNNQLNDLCTIDWAQWELRGDLWIFHIRANRFLRGMVRATVGTLLDVGTAKLSVQDFERILHSRDRTQAGMNVAAHGLHLAGVGYPPGAFTQIA